MTNLNGGLSENEFDNFYHRLRSTIDGYVSRHTSSAIAEMVLYVPDFFYLLSKLAADPRVPRANKTQILVAIAYFLSPLDIIPDAILGLGWLDDLYLAMIVTSNLLNAVDEKIVLEYWPGDEDVAVLIKNTLDRLNDKLGAGAVRRILDRLRHAEADGEGGPGGPSGEK